jgi:hypothetical protein
MNGPMTLSRYNRRPQFLALVLTLIAGVAAASCGWELNAPPDRGNRGLDSVTLSATLDTADAVRLDTIVAYVDTSFRTANTPVTFVTTAGSFVNAGSSGALSVAPDSTGVARAYLRAPSDSSLAIISVSAAGTMQSRRILFLPAPPTFLRTTASNYFVAAAPGSTVTITATVNRQRGTLSSGTVVRFELIPMDSAVTATLSADSAFVANGAATTTAVLRDTLPGRLGVRASVSRSGVSLHSDVVVEITHKS